MTSKLGKFTEAASVLIDDDEDKVTAQFVKALVELLNEINERLDELEEKVEELEELV